MSEDTQKISKNREKKMAIVAELKDKFGKAKAVVFTNYAGLTHKQIETLKKELKKAESEFVVAKNSLIKLSSDKKLEENHLLEGQTGTLFVYNDIIEPLKALAKTIKELNLPNIKFGIMDGNFITADQVNKLATLPSRDVLLVRLAFGLKSPITGLHRALNWNLQKLVMTLNAIAQSKPSTPAAPASQPSSPSIEEQKTSEPEVPSEEAVTPAQPAVQQEAPVETDENVQSAEETQTSEDKGGEN